MARLMAEFGLAGRPPKHRRNLTRQGRRPVAPDRVGRKFGAPAPDVLWCGDMTEIVTDQGKLYLAMVIDLFSRRLLGYAMSEHHDAAPVHHPRRGPTEDLHLDRRLLQRQTPSQHLRRHVTHRLRTAGGSPAADQSGRTQSAGSGHDRRRLVTAGSHALRRPPGEHLPCRSAQRRAGPLR